MDMDRLKAPFAPDKISWRVGATNKDKTKGMALAYIDARDVMERLDEVCGPENWQDRYEVHATTMICYLSIRIDDQWITKADGAGDTDVEAEKGRISDAFKRAAVRWGIGRYLYDIPSPWVEVEPHGRSYVIKQSEMPKLRAVLLNASGQPPAQAAKQDDNPFTADSPQDVAADYVSWAKNIISEMTNTDDLKQWWNDQKEQRKANFLTQTHVDELKQEMQKLASRLGRAAA